MTTKTSSPSTPDTAPGPAREATLPAELTETVYASLRTFRRNGTSVDTPVWFAWSDDQATIWFRSQTDVGKVRRLRARPEVELRPCNWRGDVKAGAVVLRGTARVVPDGTTEALAAEVHLHRRYGWQWYVMPLIRIPFTHTAKVDVSLLGKLKIIRAQRPLPDSSIVTITVS